MLLLIVVIRILSGDNRIDPIHIFIGTIILTFLASRVALHFGYFRGTSRTILILAWVGITYLAWISDGLQNNALIPYMTIILASALLLGEIDTLVLSAFCIAAIWGIAYADSTGLRITDNPEESFNLAFNLTVNYFLSTVAVYYMIRILRKSFEQGQEELIERRQMQATLRENEEKFRKVFHSSPVAICITELEDGRLLEANYAYWELTGLKPDDALEKTADELKLWNTSEERNQFVERLKSKGSFYNPDDSFEDGKGNLKRMISFYEIIHIGGEKQILSMFYDMSEQRRTMDALKESETRTRALLDAMPDMLLEITSDGLITNMIPPKGRDESIPEDEFIGRQIRDIFSESVALQTLFAVERAINGDHMNMFEFEENMGGEVRTMEARVVAKTSDMVLMILRDITQRKWVETERERLINNLELKNRESETLRNSLASIVTTFELEEVMERILDQMKLVIPYDSASVWRVEDEWQTLIISRDLPPAVSPEDLKFEIDENNSSRPILYGEKRFVLSNNVQEELSDFKEPHSYINSWLAVPLKIKGNIIGLIALDGKRKNQFNEHHTDLAVTFADQVAIALENASLFASLQSELDQRKDLIEELREINAEAETLHEITSIVAASLEVPETVRLILEQIQRVVQYDSASVWLYEENQAVMIGSRDLPEGTEKPGYYVLSDQEPDYPFLTNPETSYIVLHDIQENYPQFRVETKNYIHGWMAIPLRARGKLIGFIALDSRTPGQYQERDARLALSYSNQVSTALENARLFSDLQSELEQRVHLIAELETKNAEAETLRESTAIVAATLEKNEAIERILEQLKRVVPYDSASVQLLKNDTLEIVGGAGLPLGDEEIGTVFIINENEPAFPVLTGELPYVLYKDIQAVIPDFGTEPHSAIHSWLAIPLMIKENVMGIIALDGNEISQFSERHAQLAVTYANQVAIALENARLFSDLQAELTIRQNLISELESKNAELERFTYTVSHDLKSPLFTIRGFLGYLEEDAFAGNHERMKSDMQRITDATNKMHQLLNELLELSRIGRMKNESELIPFEELAREAVELVQGRIMERGVAVHIDADMPNIYGDRQRLLEVVQNLVDNATKFMGDQPEPRIEIGQDGEEDGVAIFYVRDNGIGIPLEHHERVFGLFNKLDVKSGGTGIGLALVKRIIEVHGGRIWIQSAASPQGEAGQGSTFYFTLPLLNNTEMI